MDELKKKIKSEIIDALKLQDVMVENISDDMPLFGGDGLELDSIDALELVVMLERCFGIKIVNAQEGKQVLFSVNTIAEFVSKAAPGIA